MRQGTRVLTGPLVGAVAIAIVLTGCGSPGSDADPTVASPPTTAEPTSTSEVVQTTPASEPSGTTTAAPTTIVAGPVDVTVAVTVAVTAAVTAAPTTIATPSVAAAPTTSVPGMSAQELAALEAELGAIDAILTELNQNLAAD